MTTRERNYWICQFLGWTVQGSLYVWTVFLWAPFSIRLLGVYVGCYTLAFLYSHQLRKTTKRQQWFSLPLGKVALRFGLASLLFGLFMGVYAPFFNWLLFPNAAPRERIGLAISASIGWTVILLSWSAIYAAAHGFERYRQAELARLRMEVVAKDSQLQALLAQVNPHFLFNSLNSIRALVVEDPSKAQEMVTELSNLLRYALQSGNRKTVSLQHELEAVDSYLRLEKIRFEDRLRLKQNIDAAALPLHLPPMLLQTLVENAVKHGISRFIQGGELNIRAGLQNSQLCIHVTNPGQLSDP